MSVQETAFGGFLGPLGPPARHCSDDRAVVAPPRAARQSPLSAEPLPRGPALSCVHGMPLSATERPVAARWGSGWPVVFGLRGVAVVAPTVVAPTVAHRSSAAPRRGPSAVPPARSVGLPARRRLGVLGFPCPCPSTASGCCCPYHLPRRREEPVRMQRRELLSWNGESVVGAYLAAPQRPAGRACPVPEGLTSSTRYDRPPMPALTRTPVVRREECSAHSGPA
jgi:hypothetical protein